ncbi:MAG TPA: helicase Ski2 [Firmicutes bacterium]|jgi:two-component system, sensor histidine kinase YesM|nr:helicase Ski2 [Bacillota bacterium]
MKLISSSLRQIKIPQVKLNSLRSKFILSFIVLSIVPMILLAFFSYRIYLGILQSNVQSYSSEVLDRVERNMGIYLSDLERVLDLRNDYYNVQFIKLSLAGDIEGNTKFTSRLWENLNSYKQLKTDLRDVAITTLDGVTVSCYGVFHTDVSQNELFQTLINRTAKEDTLAIWGPHPDWLGGRVFTVGKAIRGDYDNFLGIMSIDVDVELLDQICKNIHLGKTGYVMLVDDSGQIIYHPKPEMVGKSLSFLIGKPTFKEWKQGFDTMLGPGNQVITVKTFTPANWEIIGLSNKVELTGEMQKITSLSLIIIFGTIAALTLVAVFLAGLLTKPLKELQHSMGQASENLNTNVEIRTNDEIGQLGDSFNQMLRRIRELMEQSLLEQKKLRRTEMIALQEQIKPHFIYNTLDLIIGLLETNKNEEVINMVEALGAFFRISLSHGQEFISIREEAEHVRNYLYIQRFRHGDKYDYTIDIQEEILDNKTLKLILQPLVENAIYHGVQELEGPGGLIIIKGYSMDGQVHFEVIDNGKGMSQTLVAEINCCLRGVSTVESGKKFFGLHNVHERIGLAFGKEYGVTIESKLDVGTTVMINLPLMGTQNDFATNFHSI